MVRFWLKKSDIWCLSQIFTTRLLRFHVLWNRILLKFRRFAPYLPTIITFVVFSCKNITTFNQNWFIWFQIISFLTYIWKYCNRKFLYSFLNPCGHIWKSQLFLLVFSSQVLNSSCLLVRFWSDFWTKLVRFCSNFGQILVRFLEKIGQI